MEPPIVIFGGAGFIGRATQKALRESGLEALAFDNFLVAPAETSDAKGCDVVSPAAIKKVLKAHHPKQIFWFPARQGYRKDYANFARVQLVGTYALFQAIDSMNGYQPEKIVLASSQAIYSPGLGVTENDAMDPPSIYGMTKLQQEVAFAWFCDHRKIQLVGLRYSIVLGPGQSMQGTESGLIRNWYRAWKASLQAEIYGNGEQVRDFVHIDDVVRANLAALAYPRNEKFNSVSFNIMGESLSILTAFLAWQKLTACVDARIMGNPIRPGGEYNLTSDLGWAAQELNWRPLKRFDEMLKDFLDQENEKSSYSEG